MRALTSRNALIFTQSLSLIKDQVKSILANYNAEAKAKKQTGKVIVYSDLVGMLMSSITNIINIVTALLVAFVSISLVVSSIMIGIITFISVFGGGAKRLEFCVHWCV